MSESPGEKKGKGVEQTQRKPILPADYLTHACSAIVFRSQQTMPQSTIAGQDGGVFGPT